MHALVMASSAETGEMNGQKRRAAPACPDEANFFSGRPESD
jgi:hypothetical protein